MGPADTGFGYGWDRDATSIACQRDRGVSGFESEKIMNSTQISSAPEVRYRVTGMDCSACAAKIEKETRALPGVKDVCVSIDLGEMTVNVENQVARLSEVERKVTDLGYSLARLTSGSVNVDEGGPNLSHVTSEYKRALWIVVLINVGYGLVEMIGGLLAGSQALKADALDFLGDGLISWLGLIAIGWGLAARARAALTQGIFLGILGIAVFTTTVYRVFVLQTPQAELMGILGTLALAANVLAALVLIPHRHGDANVRAVWLFSRNDAIGNLAVIIAAVLVAWTNTPWPDLVVAGIIAALFLHSAWAIVCDARNDLARAKH